MYKKKLGYLICIVIFFSYETFYWEFKIYNLSPQLICETRFKFY